MYRCDWFSFQGHVQCLHLGFRSKLASLIQLYWRTVDVVRSLPDPIYQIHPNLSQKISLYQNMKAPVSEALAYVSDTILSILQVLNLLIKALGKMVLNVKEPGEFCIPEPFLKKLLEDELHPTFIKKTDGKCFNIYV